MVVMICPEFMLFCSILFLHSASSLHNFDPTQSHAMLKEDVFSINKCCLKHKAVLAKSCDYTDYIDRYQPTKCNHYHFKSTSSTSWHFEVCIAPIGSLNPPTSSALSVAIKIGAMQCEWAQNNSMSQMLF